MPASQQTLSFPKSIISALAAEALSKTALKATPATLILLDACCAEFVRIVCTQARDSCVAESRQVVTDSHIASALQTLGFGDLKKTAWAVADERVKKSKSKRQDRIKRRRKATPAEEKELLAAQRELLGDRPPPPWLSLSDEEESTVSEGGEEEGGGESDG